MKVLAKPGTKCPREEDSRKYIPDSGAPVTVPDSGYYRRLVKDGSLVMQKYAAPAKTGKAKEATDAK